MTTSEPKNTNPLLDFSGLPRFNDIVIAHIESGLDELLERNRARLHQIATSQDVKSWDNFVQPIEDVDEQLNRFWAPVSHLNAVMDSPALRAAYQSCLPKLSAYQTEVTQDERLYRGFQAVASEPGFADLPPAQRKIVENALRDFRLGGVELKTSAKQRFKEINQMLSTLGNQFEENVMDATRGWHLHVTNEADLEGLPSTVVAMARDAAREDKLEGWKFTLDAPSYTPFMMYAADSGLRKQMYEAYVTRASDQGPTAGQWDNSELISQILRLRKEASALLGFTDYAAYSLATKMATSTEQVMAFMGELANRSHDIARAEREEVERFAESEYGGSRVAVWDLPYYSEKLRQTRFAFSQEDLRAYFPAPIVLRGMFEVVKRLYGLEIREVDVQQRWHEHVGFYEVADESGATRGQFYVDLYARPHKRGGAWMADCIGRKRTEHGVQIPVAFLTCNFSPPTGDKPSLLTHDEVTTLFHEFGHGLHHMLTLVDHVGVAGINGVEWDAVELPSQFMENWCWERDALDLISGHVDTGEPLPDSLLKNMRAAKNFQAAMQMVRQLEFGLFDMRIHSSYDPDGRETVQDVLDAVRSEVSVIVPPTFNRFQNSFSHVFAGGYAAGYYSYKWAEVLAADAFAKFTQNGIFDRATGRRFLECILERGGSEKAMDLYRAFRGREPRIEALLKQYGLAA